MKVCVFGAGSIGCYVGGRLAATGMPVTLVGRPRVLAEIAEYGLRLTDWQGADWYVDAERLDLAHTPHGAADADLVLVTVKSKDTEAAAVQLADVLTPGTVVISLQNGLHNPERLRQRLPGHVVLAGMVPFNVVSRGRGAYHQGTEGGLDVQSHPGLTAYLPAFARAGLPVTTHEDMLAVQWAKLLLNLANSVNALADLPLREQLAQRAYRRCVAAAQAEALDLMDAAGIEPARLMAISPRRLVRVLTLPDVLFRRLARRMLVIDPLARSSMWEDLQAGRPTEVDELNGEVVRLAQRLGRAAPVNARLAGLVHAAESGGRRRWSGPQLLAELRNDKTG